MTKVRNPGDLLPFDPATTQKKHDAGADTESTGQEVGSRDTRPADAAPEVTDAPSGSDLGLDLRADSPVALDIVATPDWPDVVSDVLPDAAPDVAADVRQPDLLVPPSDLPVAIDDGRATGDARISSIQP